MPNINEEQLQRFTISPQSHEHFDINKLVAFLLEQGIMPTVQLNQQQGNNMQHSQLLSLDAHCRDSFAEQKAKIQHLSEIATRHEGKLDTLLQDTAVLKTQASEHLAKKTDLQTLELNINRTINEDISKLDSKVDDHLKWLIGGFLASAVVICSAIVGLMNWSIDKTEKDLRESIDNNKTAIVELRQEMQANHQEVSKQLTEIRSMLQEKQSSASIR